MRGALVKGAAGSALITGGGYFYDRLPRETWADRTPALRSIRESPHALAVGVALSLVGLLLLTWAWWQLRIDVSGDRGGVRRVRRATAIWAAPFLLAPPLFSADGWSYVATGDLAGRGLSPYLWTPAALPVPLRSGVSPVWRFTPSPYGPIPVAWGGALSRLTHDPWVLLAWYRALAVLALVLLAWAVPVLARSVGRDPAQALALGVASPFVLVHGIGGLHNDLVMVALVLAALAVTRARMWLPGAALIGVATAVKAPAIVAVIGVTLLSLEVEATVVARLRRVALVAGVAGGVVMATGWLTGLGTSWIGALSVPEHEYTVLSVSANLGRAAHSILRHAGTSGLHAIHDVHPELLAKRIGFALLLVVGSWALLRGRVDSRRAALTSATVALTAAVVLSPVVHYWYFLWCIPVLACLPLLRRAGSALVTLVVTLGLTAPADHEVGVGWLWLGAAALVVAPVTTWLVARLRERRPGSVPTA